MPGRDIIVNLKVKAKDAVDGLTSFGKGLDDTGKKAEKTGGLFSKLGDNVGKNLTGKLGVAGQAADALDLGLDDLGGTTAAVGAGIVAFGGFVAGGVKKMKELYDQTRDFNEVAGTSWEEGSRLIAVFDDLRVGADEGASAMQRLTRTVGTSPEVLAEFGIEVARAKDGTVDMVGTLANVATAFEKTTDPAKRAKLGNELFGKSWQNMVPVLQQGGDNLRALAAAVDETQVATEEGARQQDELFEATDNLNDAIDGLQRTLAKDAIPRLAEFAENATAVVNAISKVNDVVPIMDVLTKSMPGVGQVSMAKEAWAGLGKEFGTVGDKVGPMAKDLEGVNAPLGLTGKVSDVAATALRGLNSAAESTITRAKDAKKAFDDWRKSTEDLLRQQEELRDAERELEDTTLALERAQIAAGDASWELSDAAHVVENAINDYGAESKEAAVATEEHRRKVLETRDAMNQSAEAAVAHATKQAEASGQVLTAAERTKIYRDELVRLRDGAQDPALIAALDAQIDRLAATAAQAQNAAANYHGLVQAMNDAAGIERSFTGRDSSGSAVVRRATGGPVWPGRTYMVGEHGPELLRFDGTGPGEVLSTAESARVEAGYPSMFGPTVIQDGQAYQTGTPGGVPVAFGGSVPAFPALGGTSRSTGGAAPSGFTTGTPIIPGFGPPGVVAAQGPSAVFNITINGYADIGKLVDAIKRYEAARK